MSVYKYNDIYIYDLFMAKNMYLYIYIYPQELARTLVAAALCCTIACSTQQNIRNNQPSRKVDESHAFREEYIQRLQICRPLRAKAVVIPYDPETNIKQHVLSDSISIHRSELYDSWFVDRRQILGSL